MSGSRGPVWLPPRIVLCPSSVEDVCRAVAWSRERGVPLTPRGAGTGMPGGNVGPGAVLDLTGLSAIGDVDTDAGTVEVGAGAVASAVDQRVREHELRLTGLPSSARWCSVGGMVACNAAGARSFRYGATHAQVEAVQVVRADGTAEWLVSGEAAGGPWAGLHAHLRAALGAHPPTWPAVRKNSSGYALDRFLPTGDAAQLLVGAEGTLGIVTAARLRVHPIPSARAAVLLEIPDAQALAEVGRAARAWGASACEYFGARLLALAAEGGAAIPGELGGEAGLALVEFEGTAAEVEAGVRTAAALGADLGGWVAARDPHEVDALWEVRHAASPTVARAAARGLRSLQFIEDGVVPPTRIGAYLEGMDEILARHETEGVIFGHAGDGNLHVNPLVDLTAADWRGGVRSLLNEAVRLVADLGGTLTGEHGDGRIRAPYLERIWGADTVEAFRTVKATLDPEGLFNPGVILPLPGQDPLAGLAEGPDLQLPTGATR